MENLGGGSSGQQENWNTLLWLKIGGRLNISIPIVSLLFICKKDMKYLDMISQISTKSLNFAAGSHAPEEPKKPKLCVGWGGRGTQQTTLRFLKCTTLVSPFLLSSAVLPHHLRSPQRGHRYPLTKAWPWLAKRRTKSHTAEPLQRSVWRHQEESTNIGVYWNLLDEKNPFGALVIDN